MRYQLGRWMRAPLVALVLPLAACGPSLKPDVTTLRDVVGAELPGAQGATIADQERIDDAMTGLCATGIYEQAQCARHSMASSDRRGELGG